MRVPWWFRMAETKSLPDRKAVVHPRACTTNNNMEWRLLIPTALSLNSRNIHAGLNCYGIRAAIAYFTRVDIIMSTIGSYVRVPEGVWDGGKFLFLIFLFFGGGGGGEGRREREETRLLP